MKGLQNHQQRFVDYRQIMTLMQHRTAKSKGDLEHAVCVCEVVSWLLTDNSSRDMCLCAKNYWMNSEEIRTSSQWSVKHETWVH